MSRRWRSVTAFTFVNRDQFTCNADQRSIDRRFLRRKSSPRQESIQTSSTTHRKRFVFFSCWVEKKVSIFVKAEEVDSIWKTVWAFSRMFIDSLFKSFLFRKDSIWFCFQMISLRLVQHRFISMFRPMLRSVYLPLSEQFNLEWFRSTQEKRPK